MRKVKNKFLVICIIISMLLCSLVMCGFTLLSVVAEGVDYTIEDYTVEDYTNNDYLLNNNTIKIFNYADSMINEFDNYPYTNLGSNYKNNEFTNLERCFESLKFYII